MNKKELTILIIDDNPEDREVLQRNLMQTPSSLEGAHANNRYSFFVEETGQRGLELCEKIKPDCVLLDFNLPDMDGIEFLNRVTGKSGMTMLPVVILTGLSNEPIAIQTMQSGAQDYLVKGNITPANLHRALHNAIERVHMLRLLEEQRLFLERQNQDLEAFSYALAHDLRAPLRAIKGYAEILTHEYFPGLDGEGQRFIMNIMNASTQMDNLIDELLNYSRLGHKAVQHKIVFLQEQLDQVLASLTDRMVALGARLIRPVNDLPAIRADATLISQIFINLLDNALTYVRPGVAPVITISWRYDAGSIIISIADNGIGIAATDAERIFNIFQRVYGEEEYVGTGIGLAIVKKSVELMNGRVWVESVVGEGSTFFVKIPGEQTNEIFNY